jgi:hypothetical protein
MDPNNQNLEQPAMNGVPGQQPTPQMPPQQVPQSPANPYGFIMDAQNKPKRGLKPSTDSKGKRVLFAIVALVILLIVFKVGSSLLFGSKISNAQLLTTLVAQQQEINRVSDLGLRSASDPATTAYAETTKLSILTQQNKLLAYLKKKNVKITPLAMAALLNTKTDAALKTAYESNQFDAVYLTILRKELINYAASVKKDYATASNTTSKQILLDAYNSTVLLLK